MQKQKFGIFLSDASFDKKSNISLIGISEITTGQTFQEIVKTAKNSFEAEKEGIKLSIKKAEELGFDNIVFICDNKSAVNHIKKEYFSTNMKHKFWYAQFLWLPRRFMNREDFLSKFIKEDNVSSFKEEKEALSIKKGEEKDHKNALKFINEIESENGLNTFIKKRIEQFVCLSKGLSFQSKFFRSISKYNISELEKLIFNEIELIEKDIENIEDPFVKALAKTILDNFIIL